MKRSLTRFLYGLEVKLVGFVLVVLGIIFLVLGAILTLASSLGVDVSFDTAGKIILTLP